MRDDVKTVVAELSRCHREKLHRLQKLLLSESDKLHYEKSENLEKIFDIIGEDAGIVDEVNLIDFDIARAESELSALIGVGTAELYDHLGPGRAVEELLSLRKQTRLSLERLVHATSEAPAAS